MTWNISSRDEGCSSRVPSFESRRLWRAISPGFSRTDSRTGMRSNRSRNSPWLSDKPAGGAFLVCRQHASDFSRHRISRAGRSMAGRGAYTRSPKTVVVNRSSGQGFARQPPPQARPAEALAATQSRASARDRRSVADYPCSTEGATTPRRLQEAWRSHTRPARGGRRRPAFVFLRACRRRLQGPC